jgi:anaerobic ribonucleoside-triphosphate reductase activating protein
VDPVKLAHELLVDDPESQLTVSGGEPTEQPEALALLLRTARSLGRSTWVYTGRTLDELVQEPSSCLLDALGEIDVLVDGRFDQDQAMALPYRGSANQRIIRLTEAMSREEVEGGRPGKVSITIDAQGELVIVGVPPPGFLSDLREGLVARGLAVHPIDSW